MGFLLGLALGFLLGLALGFLLGLALGFLLGLALGFLLGLALGFLLGLAPGLFLGLALGLFLGLAFGFFLGQPGGILFAGSFDFVPIEFALQCFLGCGRIPHAGKIGGRLGPRILGAGRRRIQCGRRRRIKFFEEEFLRGQFFGRLFSGRGLFFGCGFGHSGRGLGRRFFSRFGRTALGLHLGLALLGRDLFSGLALGGFDFRLFFGGRFQ